MNRAFIALACVSVLCPLAGADEPNKKAAPATAQKVVIPFDFESNFDGGAYGQVLGEMFWKKLQRQGGFVIPESMLDVRDWCQKNSAQPSPKTPLAKMKEYVRKGQGGHIGIWGKVERVPGHETDVYDLWITIADFSVEPVATIYEKKVRTESVSEIPHVYVKEALDRLYGRSLATNAPVDPAVEERWKKAPNLVLGDFEKGKRSPLGWDPLPPHVTWIAEQAKKPANHIIRFSVPPDVAETTGVLYYSDFFPVEAGATYRFQCRWRTSATAVKVFIKCYDEVPGEFRDKQATQRREVYRSQQNPAGEARIWNTHSQDFTPTHSRFTPRWGRVILYAYYPAGSVDWDDIVVKQVAPPPKAKGK